MKIDDHLFACVAEEAGEVAQIAGKILRFGAYDCHEKTGNTPNMELLVTEVNELLALMEMLGNIGYDTSRVGDPYDKARKKQRVTEYMMYSVERGRLEK